MAKDPREWLNQAQYDLKAADTLFKNRHYIYAVFMCHLCIEKALKGIYLKNIGEPPRTHNLIFFVEKLDLNMPEELFDFIYSLNQASVPTRYPEDLAKMKMYYNKLRVNDMMTKTREALKWLKKKY